MELSGVNFAARGEWGMPPPEHGDADPPRSGRHGLVVTGAAAQSYAVERRGVVEAPGTGAQLVTTWDERRADQVKMTKSAGCAAA